MNRITEDVGRVRNYFGPGLMYTINLASLFVMVIFTMIKVNPLLTFYSLLPLPVLCFTIFYVNLIIQKRSEKIQEKLSDMTTTAQESYSGIRVVKAFAIEAQMRKFFTLDTEAYRALNLHLVGLEAVYFPIIMVLVGISTLLTVWMGGRQVIEGHLTVGNIAEFLMYIQMLTWPMAAVGWVMALIQRAFVSQRRINDFLDQAPTIKNKNNDAYTLQGDIVFDHVSFTYPHTGITAIKNLSFHLAPGQKMMILGRTGSGKSSIAQLLLRQYDASSGHIRIDGNDIHYVNLDALRTQTGYVSQDVFLFSDSVVNNIKFGNQNATIDEVKTAARLSAVDTEIEQLREGYETVIGERGVTLSGGQKQRLSIARAIIKKPRLIIMDDCLSAVDTATEKTLLDNFNTSLAGSTAIIITHRIFTTLPFDKIIVLDDGEIMEEGTHDSLMQKQGYYYDMLIAQTQATQAGEAITA
jgi:ATP-binding cassette subfamily B protein